MAAETRAAAMHIINRKRVAPAVCAVAAAILVAAATGNPADLATASNMISPDMFDQVSFDAPANVYACTTQHTTEPQPWNH